LALAVGGGLFVPTEGKKIMTTNARVVASTEKYHAAQRQGQVAKMARRLFVAEFATYTSAALDQSAIKRAFEAAELFEAESERRRPRT
jgi:hypothetical protein